MDNVIQVLDREIGFLNTKVSALDGALTTAIKERDEARAQTRLTAARAEAAELECTRLRGLLSAIPPTLSLAQWESIKQALVSGPPIGLTNEEWARKVDEHEQL